MVVPESGIVELTDGYIGVGVMGLTMFADGGDSHRNIPDAGCATRGSQTTYHTRSVLPEITITAVDADASIPVTEVKLDKTTADMEVGESVTLAATILPENATVKEVVWTTSDETIATVVDGVVTAVAEGGVTITATAGGCTATCVVTITKPVPIPVTGVSLNVSEAKVETGKTLTLAAVVTPSNATDKTITWESSNESVATVNNGIVAAISAGETVITASVGDFQATCKVTVEKVEDTDQIATVYFSYSHDAEFVKPQNGSVAALQKLDVPCFDLALYGLEQYKMAGNDRPTMLHLYIYATEVLYYGLGTTEAGEGYLYNNELIGSDVFAVSGAAGSLCMDKFWGYDMNLNYYHMLIWFGCYNKVLTSDKFTALFGNLIPAVSLLLVMVFRMVPNFMRKAIQFIGARKSIGKGAGENATYKEKLHDGMTVLGALTTWALEGSVITGDSMRARGYGTEKRSSFMIYSMAAIDWMLVMMIPVLLALVIVAACFWQMAASYTPRFTVAPLSWGIIPYGLYLLIPTFLHIKEAIQWHISRSKI